MDKFGIFKLLNSFLSKNSQSETKDTSSSDNIADTIGSIFSSLSSQQNNVQTTQKETPALKNPPLQSSMLSTLNNHDAFIKRVKERNHIK